MPLVLFPTSFGRHSQNKDFGLTDAIAGYVDSGKITIYCPDSIDLESFYNKQIHPADRMRTHNAYERVITHDVFDLARRECSVSRVAVCGASLGAYHAANIASISQDFRGESRVALNISSQSVAHLEEELWSKRFALSRGRGCFGLGRDGALRRPPIFPQIGNVSRSSRTAQRAIPTN